MNAYDEGYAAGAQEKCDRLESERDSYKMAAEMASDLAESYKRERDAARKWRDRAESNYDCLCATMPWGVRYWHDKAIKREDDRFRALDLARARGEQRDEYQQLYAAAREEARKWESVAREASRDRVDGTGRDWLDVLLARYQPKASE